jgi:aspartate carbamoyltransferase catalytic subunit
LRLQRERGSGSFVPTLREFTRTYGLTLERARRLAPATIIMHPGPINRGVEIDSRAADLPASVIDRQVTNGVPVRMAVLYLSIAGTKGEDS